LHIIENSIKKYNVYVNRLDTFTKLVIVLNIRLYITLKLYYISHRTYMYYVL